MKAIIGEAIVSCYVDAASFLAMIVLLALTQRHGRQTHSTLRIFRLLSLCVTVNCVFPFIYTAMYTQSGRW